MCLEILEGKHGWVEDAKVKVGQSRLAREVAGVSKIHSNIIINITYTAVSRLYMIFFYLYCRLASE